MAGAKKSTWIGGTAFVAVAMLAAAWFLLVSPTVATASESREQTESVRAQNDLLELQLAQLEADFAKLPEHKAELAALRVQIPTRAELAAFLRQLDEVAKASGVTVMSVTPSAPTAVVPAVSVAAPVAPATTEPAEGGATDPATTAPAPAGPAPLTGFVQVPVSITVLGGYEPTLAFVDALQRASRLFLVTGLRATGQKVAEGGGGRPATELGHVELAVDGVMYVLTDPTVLPTPTDPAAPAPVLPGAVPGKNPLIPVGGED
ncbi:hypothetical protein [Cellulomonas cellasea]|uniref:Pilus assembly protein PilO n=2 Tax=Cellulomonas cellasea TaxID=43670 RepID=A0A0A0B9U0_9CELL|nr:hypothetical protein [Cellulomonas cellasea]KGM02902.1 hypothetical protein Q760_10780 [Cellulomonas cellasea DSM 20118]GEA88802.1 hypothetical protein CCE01nite_27510 [Cellulomonas cellasea]